MSESQPVTHKDSPLLQTLIQYVLEVMSQSIDDVVSQFVERLKSRERINMLSNECEPDGGLPLSTGH